MFPENEKRNTVNRNVGALKKKEKQEIVAMGLWLWEVKKGFWDLITLVINKTTAKKCQQ